MRYIKRYAPLGGLGLFVLALVLLHSLLREVHFRDIRAAFQAIPLSHTIAAIALTLLSYIMLSQVDVLGFLYLKKPLSYLRTVFASFVGYSFSNSFGYSVVSGGSIRYRLYSAWGLDSFEIARLVAFCTLTGWLGFASVAGTALLLEPGILSRLVPLSTLGIQLLGALLAFLPLAYLVLLLTHSGPLRIRAWDLALPSVRLGFWQILFSCLDLSLSAGVLYALLPEAAGLTFFAFVSVFIASVLMGLISHVPGGLGVFEASILLLLGPYYPSEDLLAALLMFRLVYYLFPLGVAALSLAAYEFAGRREFVDVAARFYTRWLSPVVPTFLALLALLCGAILLFSGATPSLPDRIQILRVILPLPLIEFSHFMASVMGILLILLARALQRRVLLAYWITTGLLFGGALFSLMKGLDYEEAAVLFVMIAVLVPSRPFFTRRASLLAPRASLGWLTALGIVILGFAWLGLFCHTHHAYASETVWQFVTQGEAPHFVRAFVGVVAVLLATSLSALFAPVPYLITRTDETDWPVVEEIVARSPRTSAHLALLKDKNILMSTSRQAFVMYAVEGRSFVSMGDPVGSRQEQEELIWQFREFCHAQGGWPVFYQVRSDMLPCYLDQGLSLVKLGEEGRVFLPDFSLEGSRFKEERHTLRRLEGEGNEFEIVPTETVPSVLPQLRQISDEWLAAKNTREKRFSLGRFDEEYLRRFPHAVVRHGSEILAFATLWTGAEREEMSIDLMRYSRNAPKGVMDFLFLHLILLAKDSGYRWFNLGMAPLAGFERRSLAPLWSRMGAFIFEHAEHFYNFQGVRRYKAKFDPIWEPCYLASPSGLVMPRILANVSTLIAGGTAGVFWR